MATNPAGRGRIEWSIGLPRQRNRQIVRTEPEAQKVARTLSQAHPGVKVTVYRDRKSQHEYRDGQWVWTAVQAWKRMVSDDDWWQETMAKTDRPWLRANPSAGDGKLLLLALAGLVALGVYQQRKVAESSNGLLPAPAAPPPGVHSLNAPLGRLG